MVRRYGYLLDLMLILAVGGCLVIFAGCEMEEEYGKFTEEQMDNFGNQQQMTLPDLSGGIVLSIGKETITADEVMLSLENTEQRKQRDIRQFAKNSSMIDFSAQVSDQAGEIVIGKATSILLYEKAKAEAGDQIDAQLKKFVETEKNSFISRHGNNYAEAEKTFKREGITDWKDFEDKKKEEMLTQMYLSKRREAVSPVTYNQMLAYFEENREVFKVEGSMEFLLIDIIPSKLKAEQINIAMGQSASGAAVQLADKLVKKLRAGTEFGEFVREYSNGVYANKGGAWGKVTFGSLVEPYGILEELAEKTEVGGISDPIETNGHVFIMKLLSYNKGGNLEFQDVRDDIRLKLEDLQQVEQTHKIFSEVMDETSIGDLMKFVDLCVVQAYQIWSRG